MNMNRAMIGCDTHYVATISYVFGLWALVGCVHKDERVLSGREVAMNTAPQKLEESVRSLDELHPCKRGELDGYESHLTTSAHSSIKTRIHRVYRVKGGVRRLVCRELDVTGDGQMNHIRIYNEKNEPIKERYDQDLDGYLETTSFFLRGDVSRVEIDSNRDERADIYNYYEEGVLTRTEVKQLGGDDEMTPSQWYYYKNARLIRFGEDKNQDGSIDVWFRRVEEQATAEVPSK